MTINPITKRDWSILLVVVVVAAALRLYQIDIAEYRVDETNLSKMALDMAHGKAIPRLGLAASAGIPGSPLTVYLMAIPYAISVSPVVATVFIAGLNIAGVALLWIIGHRYFSTVVGGLAGLAYAVNPWALIFARKIWPPDYTTPFALLAIFLGCYGFWEQKRWAQMLTLPAVLLAYSMHHEGGLAIIPLLAIVWVGRKNIVWKAVLISVALTLLVLLPLIIGVVQEGFAQSFTIFSGGKLRAIQWTDYPILATLELASGLEVSTYIALSQLKTFDAALGTPTQLWLIVVCGATGIGMLAVWIHYRRAALALWLWVWVPVLLFVPNIIGLVIHYYVVVIPGLSLLAAIGAEAFIRLIPEKRMRGRLTGILAFSAILLTQGAWWVGMINYVAVDSIKGGFSTPLRYFMTVRDALNTYDNIILTGGGVINKTNSLDLWGNFLYDKACFRELYIPEGGVAVFPKGRFATLSPPNVDLYPAGNLYTSGTSQTFPLRPGEGEYTVNTFETPPAWTGIQPTNVPPARFDNGIQLTGYALNANQMYLWWTLPDTHPALNYQYFGHFLDGDGNKLGQRDTSFWYTQHWCPGDRIVTWVDVNVPADTKTLRVGMYSNDNGSFVNTNVLDEAGNPVSQWVDIPLKAASGS